jgi:hypothetical protein
MSEFKLALSALVVLFSLLSTQVQGDTTVTACSDLTNNKNTPFLTYLKSLTVDATLTNVNKLSTTTDICDGIWESAGRNVCCDTRLINKAFFAIIFDGFTNWRNFIKSLVTVRRIIKKYDYNRDELQQKLNSMVANPTLYDFGGITASQLLSIFDWAVAFETELYLFRTGGLNCYTNLTATRASSVCQGCAYQNAYTYFTNALPTRFRFKATACDSLWVSCSRSWRFIINIQLLYYTIQQLNLYDNLIAGQVKLVRPDLFYDLPDATASATLLKDGLTALNLCISGDCSSAALQTVCHYMFSVTQSDRLYIMNENLLLNMSIYLGSGAKSKEGLVSYVSDTDPLGPGLDIALAKPSVGNLALNSTQLNQIDLSSAGGIRSGRIMGAMSMLMILTFGILSTAL